MSYIVAYVHFAEAGADYPVECFRTDLKVGDLVVVLLADGRLRSAAVTTLRYLNWNCRGQILCKRDETATNSQGEISLPKGLPIHVGLATADALVASLRTDGWTPLLPSSKTYRSILSYSNDTQTSNILIRRNGVDIQILPERSKCAPEDYSVFQGSLAQGRLVRHFLSHTTFNLFEGIKRFSISFQNNENNYDRFFSPVGGKDRRTTELKELARNDLKDIYDAMSAGVGEPVYLGDGIWLNSRGRTRDGGR